jgi:hypothetical protein
MVKRTWVQWGEEVLRRTEENADACKQCNERVHKLEVAFEALKGQFREVRLKAGFWGALAGAVPAIIALVWWLLKSGKGG